MNRQLVLAEIIKNTPISRVRLSEITGLNKSTISSQVAALMEPQPDFEIGQGHSSGGRRPVMLVFNKNGGYTIGVDIGVDYLNVVLTDLSGNILLINYSPLENNAYEAVEKKLFEKIRLMKEKMTDTTYGLAKRHCPRRLLHHHPAILGDEVGFGPPAGWDCWLFCSLVRGI